MPKIDLMGLFNDQYPGSPENLEQRSFYFEQSPEVYFVDSNGKIVDAYDFLPRIDLTIKEQELLAVQPEPKLNEPQVLVKEVMYEDGKIFLQACKCDYKFLAAYSSGKIFPKDSPIYEQTFFKTGSIAILITSDDKTVIVERNDAWKLFSSFSGFLKPQTIQEENVAITTAIEEAQEEFLQYTSIKFKHAEIGSLSFRKGNITGKFGTAEFLVKLRVDCTADKLMQALDENLTRAKKPDGKPDHTGRYKLIDPKNISQEVFEITEEDTSIKKIRDISFFLVDPIVMTTCKFLGVEIPQFMQRQSLNDIIESRQTNENQEESWCAYIQRRALECFDRSKGYKEL